MSAAVIIYGPPGCGKTQHALELARHFDKPRIIDDEQWKPGDAAPADALILTQFSGIPGAIDFADAMQRLAAT